MQRTLLSLFAIPASLLVQAQLAPGTDAPLIAHMTEVNAQWRVMDPAPPDGAQHLHFRTDVERIALHLHRVHDFLATHAPEGLPPSAMEQRTFLLEKLEAYADRGIFPINDVVPYRNPVFIDRVGTACAVGQLMIESGHRAIAQSIHDANNLVYVHDLHRTDVDQWAVEHGFTEDELAWIQPGYEPNVPWASLGGGTNGPVQALVGTAGGVVVAGQFTEAGGTPYTRVALWNGSSYMPMGSLPPFNITCAAEYNGDIYLGGNTTESNGNDLLKWSAGTWTAYDIFMGKNPGQAITALYSDGTSLYAAGSSSGFAGTDYYVQRLSNGTWTNVGQSLNNTILSITSFDGALVCGGQFTSNVHMQNNDIVHVAKLNGNIWEQLGDGLDGAVHAFLTLDGSLYAGGDLVTEIVSYFGLARISGGGTEWEQLMPNVMNYMSSPTDGLVSIHAMATDGTRIFLGGDFDCYQGMFGGMGVATFEDTPDNVQPFCQFGGSVEALHLAGANLIAGGSGTMYDNIAITDLSTGISEAGMTGVSVWPNPTTDLLRISTPAPSAGLTAQVIDATGRVVMASAIRGTSTDMDVRTLSNGTYTLRLSGTDGLRTARFVKR